VLVLPQNLDVYAAAAGEQRLLATAAAQAVSALAQKERLFSPWQLTAPPRRLKLSLNKNFNLKADSAYTENRRPFPAELWQQLESNSNKAAYPSSMAKGITLRHTNLRAMPTGMPFYLNPDTPGEGFPFDYFQHSSVPVATPVFICHAAGDGQWLLVETAVSAGWLPAQDVAEVDENFMQTWQSRPLAALVRDKVPLGAGLEHIGALLPLAQAGPQGRGHALSVYYPVREGNGKAGIRSITLRPEDAVAVPLMLTPAEVSRVGNEMMGQAYGWGGLAQRRDCSALTRDLFAPFGVWLPRNSSRQARMGSPVSLAGISNEEKEARILSQATPFLSLIWLPGHIGLYIGQYQGKALMFHNMWGLRTHDGNNSCNGRAVVGKAVVTTLRPGAERSDICSPASILDRMQRVAVLLGNNADQVEDEQ
jgi:cell wall-associated NlpC family hydrolase